MPKSVAKLRQLARGEGRESVVLLWGVPGSGRTHLLRAAVAARDAARGAYDEAAATASAEPPAAAALVAVDDVDQADAAAQGRLFTLYNRLQETGGQLLVAASVAPGRLRAARRPALAAGLGPRLRTAAARRRRQARRRSPATPGSGAFALSDDVIAYLLAHGRRDMATLLATLAALDRHSLALRRPMTVPLLREWLQRGLPFPPGPA